MSPTTYTYEPEAPVAPPEPPETVWREWMMVALGLTALVAIVAVIAAVVAFAQSGGDSATPAAAATTKVVKQSGTTPAPTLAQAKGIAFEPFKPVDPTLPAVPAGAVKKFHIDVDQHVVQVDPALAPTEVWTYVINGKTYPGTAASAPIVVNQGDKVEIDFTNGGSKAMHVTMAHSLDFHAAEVAPNKYYVDVAPGKTETIRFVAEHPGVFMYHCATQPVLMHVSNGMAGMLVVKPKGLPRVDKELWVTQSEYYIGKPGQGADEAKMNAETPDVVAFNGYANQYKANPITVRRGERIRMYVMNTGPSKWSAFHVIGTVFDTTHIEGVVGHDSQTISLAPSQGGWVDFTLDQTGNYPFVTHNFGDMVKGAAGMLHTEGAPMPAKPETAVAPKAGGVGVTLGEMFVKPSVTSVKAGKVTFDVANQGQSMHQFAIGHAPLALDGGQPAASAALTKGKMLMGGGKETISAKLTPGKYILYCLMSGHYAAGQHTQFTVHP